MTPPERAKRSRLPGQVETQIRQHLREHPDWTAAQIWDAIGRSSTSLRSVERRYAAFHADADANDTWTPLDAKDDPDGAALVLPVLQYAPVTVRDAEWIVTLRRMCPTLSNTRPNLELAWYLARVLRRHDELSPDAARAGGLPPLSQVTSFLAYAPWEDEGAGLAEAVARREVPYPVAFLGGYENAVPAAVLAKLIEETE